MHFPCQSRNIFWPIFAWKTHYARTTVEQFATEWSILHCILQMRRKLLVAKELHQTRPAARVVNPYAVRRYVARQPKKNENPQMMYICSFVIIVALQFIDHFHGGIAQCYTYDISKSHTHKVYTVHPCTSLVSKP